jgi:anti-sigma regulatory factor (Ser/Thr protein kinase)
VERTTLEGPGALDELGAWWLRCDVCARLEKRLASRVELCLTEAVSNALGHGGAGKVTVQLDLRDDWLRVTLVDAGRAFDPLAAPAPERPSSLEQARVGGLGVHFLRHYTDALEYRRVDGANRLLMAFRLED